MIKKIGRPNKLENQQETKKIIIDTTVELIKKYGADWITIRKICKYANIATGTFYYHFRDKDDLLMFFLRDISFDSIELKTPLESIDKRISELYMHLISRYIDLGNNFMKNFYTTNNISLSAYMSEVNGKFLSGTVMERSEIELNKAKEKGIINKNVNVHEICMDICTIVKGCVFEWCLSNGNMDLKQSLQRIIGNYLNSSKKI